MVSPIILHFLLEICHSLQYGLQRDGLLSLLVGPCPSAPLLPFAFLCVVARSFAFSRNEIDHESYSPKSNAVGHDKSKHQNRFDQRRTDMLW